MVMEKNMIYGLGIKSKPVSDRWNSRAWKKLACLFIENSRQSRNMEYLLEHYGAQVIEGIEICRKELSLEHVCIYYSSEYKSAVEKLEASGIETIPVDNKKDSEPEVFGEDTLVHHAETMVGLSRFASGEPYVPKKIITITGDVKQPGIYEIPLGTSFRQIIEEYGQGSETGKKIQFVQAGGNTGTVFSEEELDTPFTYDTLAGSGTMMETAKLEVFPADTCIVDWAYKKMLENSRETCGKCVYCREGLYQLYRIIQDGTQGKGRDGDMLLVEELCRTIKAGTLCDFGRSASNPLMTAIKKFPDEFEKHMERKQCSTLNCIAYASYYIDPAVCSGCGACMVCPGKAIRGVEQFIHIIDQNCCDKCGECEAVCNVNAVKRYGTVKPQLPSEPVAAGTYEAAGQGMKKGLGRRRRII